MGQPLLYGVSAWIIAAALLLGMIAIWKGFYLLGAKKAAQSGRVRDLSPVDAAVAGLLALILAFSFNMASERFDAREEVIVREANALETAHLRCDFLLADEQVACRDALRRYARLRVAFYESARDTERFRAVLDQSERVQRELWETVKRSQQSLDTPAQALAIASINELIDLHTERLAAQRRIVPQEVTWMTLTLCLAWSAFVGYACGLALNHQLVSWFGFALLVSLVLFLDLDLDRPGRGFVRPVRGHAVMVELERKLALER